MGGYRGTLDALSKNYATTANTGGWRRWENNFTKALEGNYERR